MARLSKLFETANAFVTRPPFQSFCLLAWLVGGKSLTKMRLTERSGIDSASVPYNGPLIEWLREQKAPGRPLVLDTASHRRLAEAIAWHLDLFDEVLTTEGEVNLKSRHKRDRLVSRCGDRGFDYIGNDDADLAVWDAAERAQVVSSPPSRIGKARALGNADQVFDDGRPPIWKTAIKAVRPHHWRNSCEVGLYIEMRSG